jgi:ankyrin repeat protein
MRRRLAISIVVALGVIGHSMTAIGQSMGKKDLLNAVAHKDVDPAQIQTFLSRGAAIDARDEAGRTALLIATHGNRIEAARALIRAGADVNAKDPINDSP